MTFKYDILPFPTSRGEGVVFDAALQYRFQRHIEFQLLGREMTDEDAEDIDRMCFALAGMDYDRWVG